MRQKKSKELIIATLTSHIRDKAPIARSASQLGISPQMLNRYMRKYGIRLSNSFYLVIDTGVDT